MKYDAQGREVVGFPTEEDVTVTGDWTFNGGGVDLVGQNANGYNLVAEAAGPAILFDETDAASDEGHWDIAVTPTGNLAFRTRNDAFNSGATWMNAARTGTVVNEIEFSCASSVILRLTDELQAEFRAGSVTVPSITFASDLDTGFYWGGATGDFRVTSDGALIAGFGNTSANPFNIYGADTVGDCFMGFYDSAASRKGYVGYGGSASDELYLTQEEAAEIRLRISSSDMVRVSSSGVAFNGAAPAARPDYTVTNPSTDRALNVTGDTLAQVAAVLGTLIADLIAIGLLQ